MDDLEFAAKRSIAMLKEDPKAARQAFAAVAREFCAFHGVTHRDVTPEQCKDRQMTEDNLKSRITARAKTRGWKVAHAGKGIAAFDKTGNPIFVTPMAKGWPDLFMLHPKYGALAMELKTEQGEVSSEQYEWLNAFIEAGIPAVIIRPSDLREGRVNVILGGR